ncbi:MAG: integrase [Burkholderiales bacterium RIFCSPLOWO2_12_67_14]|nr:MAG: integrase [Burkholderiales bacterium RIFCSPLOWO2_02_FULL_67_64]OGB40772.1 MAG: integrase [Burkholderiales bacterium RIFCSPLOWO2_12_67_14]OGB47912.1 MAG: integrase [Burkholderiales bacterium RIFCSPHIGHO2_12_FULL_67_38]
MNVLKPHLQTTIWTLLKGGATQREIERITGISRHTIRSYQQRFAADPANCPGVATDPRIQTAPPWPPTLTPVATPVATSRCEPHRTFIDAQLRLGRNATAIYQDLVDLHGFDGAYNSVKRFAAQLRHKEPEQFDRLSFAPGEEMQVDYGEGAPTRVPGTERWRKPRLFVATLRYSRRSFRRVVWNSGQQVWAELHEQAWRYFGGSARYVVLDNLKEGVLKPDLYEPALNPVYAATLAHYEVVADPARVRDPNRKGTVEHAIGHTQATALKGRRFESIEEQNAFLEHWEVKWAASRIHGAERRQVQAMFEEERAHLQPLPITGMSYFTEVQRTVCDDSCVRIEHSSYAARPAPIGSKVLVRIFERRIEIRDLRTQTLLRTHARVERPGTVVLPMAERVFNPSRETRFILSQARAIGPQAARLCEMLFAIEGRVGQRKLWGIVNLARRYPHRFIDAACEAAMEQGVHSYRHVKALTERLVADALAALEADAPTPALTQQHALIRSADEYGDLFVHAATATQSSESTQP